MPMKTNREKFTTLLRAGLSKDMTIPDFVQNVVDLGLLAQDVSDDDKSTAAKILADTWHAPEIIATLRTASFAEGERKERERLCQLIEMYAAVVGGARLSPTELVKRIRSGASLTTATDKG